MSELWDTVLLAVVTLAFFGVLFVPLELAFRRRKQKPFGRPAQSTDLAFFLGQQLLFSGLILSALAGLAPLLEPTGLQAAVASQPLWLQVLEVVLLGDLTVYWGHRLSHQVPWLWRFHRVHHTSPRLDWLAAWREHPVDGLFTQLLENLPALLLGFPLELIAGFVVFRGIWAVFIHSNVRLPLGPLKVLLGAPELHHWHHDAERGGRCNFANLSPLMDVLFGTYYDPPGLDPERFGLGGGETHPETYLGLLVDPLLPRASSAPANVVLAEVPAVPYYLDVRHELHIAPERPADAGVALHDSERHHPGGAGDRTGGDPAGHQGKPPGVGLAHHPDGADRQARRHRRAAASGH